MNLLFIYGAPGVGKLTVANELSIITGYSVFHNHIAIDLVKSIYGSGTKSSEEMIMAVNISAIIIASERDINLIFTYARPNDTIFIKNVVNIVKSKGGNIFFIELKCNDKVLQARLVTRSDSMYSKIAKKADLKAFGKKYGPFGMIKLGKGMSIDTSGMSSKQTVSIIAKELGIKKAIFQ